MEDSGRAADAGDGDAAEAAASGTGAPAAPPAPSALPLASSAPSDVVAASFDGLEVGDAGEASGGGGGGASTGGISPGSAAKDPAAEGERGGAVAPTGAGSDASRAADRRAAQCLVDIQSGHGYFEATKEFAAAVGVADVEVFWDALRAAGLETAAARSGETGCLVATAAAVAWMALHPDVKDVCGDEIERASKWLGKRALAFMVWPSSGDSTVTDSTLVEALKASL